MRNLLNRTGATLWGHLFGAAAGLAAAAYAPPSLAADGYFAPDVEACFGGDHTPMKSFTLALPSHKPLKNISFMAHDQIGGSIKADIWLELRHIDGRVTVTPPQDVKAAGSHHFVPVSSGLPPVQSILFVSKHKHRGTEESCVWNVVVTFSGA
jgi:hypothetical protein